MLGCSIFPLRHDLMANVLPQLLIKSGTSYIIADAITGNENIPIIKTSQLQATVTTIQKNLSSLALPLNTIHLIIATSGSTAIPKAVMLTGNNITAAVTASLKLIPLIPTDRWLQCLPLYHIGGISIIYRCAHAAATVVMLDNGNNVAIAQALVAHHCTHISLVPSMLARLLDIMPTPPPQLKYVLIGGAALDPALAHRALAQNWPLCISYGMSETCSQIATLCNPPSNWPGQLVGKPLSGMQVRIDHTTKRIQVRGKMLMAGYANPNHHSDVYIEENSWFTTADLGYIDVYGQLWITGRADEIINSGGIKIHPAQIEILLKKCPDVIEIAIIGKPNPIWGDIIVAVYVGTIEPTALEAWCRQHLHSTMRPREFIQVKNLPRTALEKLDYIAIRAIA